MNTAASNTTLPDGRRFAWSEWGATDGDVVIFCHGDGFVSIWLNFLVLRRRAAPSAVGDVA